MTREENLHWLNQEIETWENECQSKHPIKEALYAARKSLEQEPRWIPVTERLPDKLTNVNIAFDDCPNEYDVAYLRTTVNETYRKNGAENEWVSLMGEATYIVSRKDLEGWLMLGRRREK